MTTLEFAGGFSSVDIQAKIQEFLYVQEPLTSVPDGYASAAATVSYKMRGTVCTKTATWTFTMQDGSTQILPQETTKDLAAQ